MTKIIIEILGIVITILITFLIAKVREYLAKAIEEIEDEDLRENVRALVSAAEQQYKAVEHAGEQKKDYVVHELIELGYELTAYVNALIESEVYKL